MNCERLIYWHDKNVEYAIFVRSNFFIAIISSLFLTTVDWRRMQCDEKKKEEEVYLPTDPTDFLLK